MAEKRTVAIIGVGMMGAAIAQRFLDCGHTVRLHTRSPEKLQPLVARDGPRGPWRKQFAVIADTT